MNINIYEHQFISTCPENGKPIIYSLRIETTGRMIHVEHIVTATAMIKSGYHETIADELYRRFAGKQVLKAHHYGVDITTERGAM